MKNEQVEELPAAMVEQSKQLDQSEIFLTNLARKVDLFFPWQNQRSSLMQHLWKSERITQAFSIHPQLSLDEVQKLIQRDWRMMPEQEKKKVVEEQLRTVQVEQQCAQIEKMIAKCSDI